MRQVLALLTFGLAVATSAAAQEPPPPLITLTPPLVDLGIQQPNIKVETLFELTNGTDHVVFIESIVGGCAKCLEYEYDNKKIEAGETKKIKAILKTDSRGSGNFTIRIKITDRDIPELESRIRYTVIPVLDPTPAAVDFGDVVIGEELQEVVTVATFVPRSMKELKLEPILTGSGPVRLEVGELKRTSYTELLDQAELKLTLRAKAQRQNLEGFSLMLVFPAGPSAELRVPIQGRVVSQRFLQRSLFHLGSLKVGEVRKKTYVIPYVSDEADIKIVSVTSNRPELKATARLNPKTMHLTLSVEFQGTEVGEVRAVIRILTSLREEPFLVRLGGKVRKKGRE